MAIFKKYLGEDIKKGKEKDFLNKARNSVKHAKSKDGKNFEFLYHGDIKVEAEDRLELAIKNYERIYEELPNEMENFLMRNLKNDGFQA